jgi:hypothetical protein
LVWRCETHEQSWKVGLLIKKPGTLGTISAELHLTGCGR